MLEILQIGTSMRALPSIGGNAARLIVEMNRGRWSELVPAIPIPGANCPSDEPLSLS